MGTIQIPEKYPPACLLKANAPNSSNFCFPSYPHPICLFFSLQEPPKELTLFSFNTCPTYSVPGHNPLPPSTQLWCGAESKLHCSTPYPWIVDPKAITDCLWLCFITRKLEAGKIWNKYGKLRKSTKILIIPFLLMIFCISHLFYISSLG